MTEESVLKMGEITFDENPYAGIFMPMNLSAAAGDIEHLPLFRQCVLEHVNAVSEDFVRGRNKLFEDEFPNIVVNEGPPLADAPIRPFWDTELNRKVRADVTSYLDKRTDGAVKMFDAPLAAGCTPKRPFGWGSSRVVALTRGGVPWLCHDVVADYETRAPQCLSKSARALLMAMPIAIYYEFYTAIQ